MQIYTGYQNEVIYFVYDRLHGSFEQVYMFTKLSEESFSMDEIMITVALLTLNTLLTS